MTRAVENPINTMVQVLDSNGDKVTTATVNYIVYFYNSGTEAWEEYTSGTMTHIGNAIYNANWTPEDYGEFTFYAYCTNPKMHETYTYYVEDSIHTQTWGDGYMGKRSLESPDQLLVANSSVTVLNTGATYTASASANNQKMVICSLVCGDPTGGVVEIYDGSNWVEIHDFADGAHVLFCYFTGDGTDQGCYRIRNTGGNTCRYMTTTFGVDARSWG